MDKDKTKITPVWITFSVFWGWLIFLMLVYIACMMYYTPDRIIATKLAEQCFLLKRVEAGVKNGTVANGHELGKQKETLDEIKRQNEEIIKLLSNGR